MSEAYYIDDVFGNRFQMAGDWIPLSPGNFGAPPIAYQTVQNFNQDGEKVLGYVLTPRIIALQLYRAQTFDLTEYNEKRAEILRFLRPDRAPFIFVVTRDNADSFSLTIRPDTGLLFGPVPVEDGNLTNIDEAITLIAHDPIWFATDEVSESPTVTVDNHMEIPTPIPTEIGLGGGLFSTGSINYGGTWQTYPTITLTGAYTIAILTNTFTGVSVTLDAPVGDLLQRILTLDPNNLSVVDGNGVNKVSEVSADSNLIDFAIFPDSILNGSTQSIEIRLESAGVNAAVTIAYNERFYGI